MDDEFLSQTSARKSAQSGGKARVIISAVLVAFLFGVAVTAFVAWRSGADFGFFSSDVNAASVDGQSVLPAVLTPSPSPSESEVEAAAEAVEAVEKVAEQQGGLDQRLIAMEQRLSQLGLQAEAATGNVARAEGLLIAFATRRAIDRGTPLGYLADQLKLRFGDAQPNAVQLIIDSAERPVTLDQLLARLEGLAPKLSVSNENQISWDWFKQELSGLFVVRREASPSPAPKRRLERARLFLESGRVEAAVAEVRNLPGADEAKQWMADAERFASVARALDLLETTAVLDPREFRDGSGNRVEQLSPAGEGGE